MRTKKNIYIYYIAVAGILLLAEGLGTSTAGL